VRVVRKHGFGRPPKAPQLPVGGAMERKERRRGEGRVGRGGGGGAG
jgi:hypothetical protein